MRKTVFRLSAAFLLGVALSCCKPHEENVVKPVEPGEVAVPALHDTVFLENLHDLSMQFQNRPFEILLTFRNFDRQLPKTLECHLQATFVRSHKTISKESFDFFGDGDVDPITGKAIYHSKQVDWPGEFDAVAFTNQGCVFPRSVSGGALTVYGVPWE